MCLPLLIFPCTIKSRSSLLAPFDASTINITLHYRLTRGWSRKKGLKRLRWLVRLTTVDGLSHWASTFVYKTMAVTRGVARGSSATAETCPVCVCESSLDCLEHQPAFRVCRSKWSMFPTCLPSLRLHWLRPSRNDTWYALLKLYSPPKWSRFVFVPFSGTEKAFSALTLPSVLWRCWLVVRKSIWPVKDWVAGVVICLEWGANDLHMAQPMPLLSHCLLLH